VPEAEGAADIKRPTRSSPTSKTFGRAIGCGHAIAVRSTRSWRELDSNFRFRCVRVPSGVRTRYWASCHSGLMFGGPSRTRAERSSAPCVSRRRSIQTRRSLSRSPAIRRQSLQIMTALRANDASLLRSSAQRHYSLAITRRCCPIERRDSPAKSSVHMALPRAPAACTAGLGEPRNAPVLYWAGRELGCQCRSHAHTVSGRLPQMGPIF
jgi:hypothetical protein